MKYEEVLSAVGGCGRYQVFILGILYVSIMLNGFQVGIMVFMVPEIKHRCSIPGLSNDTYEIQNENHAELIKEYIPEEMVDGKLVYSKCDIYANRSVLGNQSLSKCSSWVYDKSIFETTITSDFNFVCGQKWRLSQIYTVYFVGFMVSMLSCGWLADRLGRKKVIVATTLLQGLSGVASSQISNYNVILFLRFLTAFGGGGSSIPTVSLGIEIASVKKRTYSSMISQMFFTFGMFCAVGLAYVLRTWRLNLLLLSGVSVLFALLFVCLLPESPRWLLTRNKKKEAERILNTIARVNKHNFNCNSEDIEVSVTEERTVRLWKIFTIKKLRKRSFIMMLNWFLICFGYYALIVNTENLSGDIFLNFTFSTFVEIPAYIICLALLNRVGRKWLYSGFMFTGGMSAIVAIFPAMYASDDLQWTTSALAILCKLCISGTFAIVYLHSCELYPTCIRNAAVGAFSTFGRFGSIIAPYVMMLEIFMPGKLGKTLPLLVMGLSNVLAAISYLFLPETNNKPLQDTFDDITKYMLVRTSENGECKFDEDSTSSQLA